MKIGLFGAGIRKYQEISYNLLIQNSTNSPTSTETAHFIKNVLPGLPFLVIFFYNKISGIKTDHYDSRLYQYKILINMDAWLPSFEDRMFMEVVS